MLARLQRIATVALLALTLGWPAVCAWLAWPWWSWLGALVPMFGNAAVLGLEFLLLPLVRRGDTTPPASARALARAWLVETVLAVRVFNWRQPFRSHAQPDTMGPALMPKPLPTPSPSPRGVVLVHGFICNRGFWLPILAALRTRGIPYIAVDLEPVFADSIDEYTRTIDAAVARAWQETGRAPVIVAHSMGGIAVRAWMAWNAHRGPQGFEVARVITIGSPHSGTWLARFARHANARQMCIGSSWMQRLDAAERPGDRSRFVCFYSDCDNVVMPPATATLTGADNRFVAGQAHMALAFHPKVLEAVVEGALSD